MPAGAAVGAAEVRNSFRSYESFELLPREDCDLVDGDSTVSGNERIVARAHSSPDGPYIPGTGTSFRRR